MSSSSQSPELEPVVYSIVSGINGTDNPVERPILQVRRVEYVFKSGTLSFDEDDAPVKINRLDNGDQGEGAHTWVLLLSDGEYILQGVLAPSLHPMINRPEFAVDCYVQLEDYYVLEEEPNEQERKGKLDTPQKLTRFAVIKELEVVYRGSPPSYPTTQADNDDEEFSNLSARLKDVDHRNTPIKDRKIATPKSRRLTISPSPTLSNRWSDDKHGTKTLSPTGMSKPKLFTGAGPSAIKKPIFKTEEVQPASSPPPRRTDAYQHHNENDEAVPVKGQPRKTPARGVAGRDIRPKIVSPRIGPSVSPAAMPNMSRTQDSPQDIESSDEEEKGMRESPTKKLKPPHISPKPVGMPPLVPLQSNSTQTAAPGPSAPTLEPPTNLVELGDLMKYPPNTLVDILAIISQVAKAPVSRKWGDKEDKKGIKRDIELLSPSSVNGKRTICSIWIAANRFSPPVGTLVLMKKLSLHRFDGRSLNAYEQHCGTNKICDRWFIKNPDKEGLCVERSAEIRKWWEERSQAEVDSR